MEKVACFSISITIEDCLAVVLGIRQDNGQHMVSFAHHSTAALCYLCSNKQFIMQLADT